MAKKEGMTLMELIIVLAIIAALVGFTFAILNKVRQRAYLGQCISNLRQLLLAVHMYENEWGTVPIEHPTETPEGLYGFVQQMLFPYYVSDSRIFICPADVTGGRGEDGAPMFVRWQGRDWLISYRYFVNDVVVHDYGKGSTRLRSDSPLFKCSWHVPHLNVLLIARYNGTVEVSPFGLIKRLHALFEGVEYDE